MVPLILQKMRVVELSVTEITEIEIRGERMHKF